MTDPGYFELVDPATEPPFTPRPGEWLDGRVVKLYAGAAPAQSHLTPGASKWQRRRDDCRARKVCPYCHVGKERPALHGDRCARCYRRHAERAPAAMRRHRARKAGRAA